MIQTLTKHTIDDMYPFNVTDFHELNLNASVVFFTGANGSGKSTLLRIISDLTSCIDLGKSRTFNFETKKAMTNAYTLSSNPVMKKGYYFQSEDFFNYLSWAESEEVEYKELLADVDARHKNKTTLEYQLESGLQRGNMKAMRGIVDELKDASHGEGYIRFFKSRLRDNALYLLDEPETPLSFENQLSLIRLIVDATKRGCQFIICTHSPILLAIPEAKIFYFDEGIEPCDYKNHPLVHEYQSFLDNPERYMYYLLSDD